MSNITVLASENYVSFLVAMGEDGTLGCHLPRSDASELSAHIQHLVSAKKGGEYFPEIEYETATMQIEGMAAGESVMLSFVNKMNEKRTQFAIEDTDCIELAKKMEGVLDSTEHIHGPAMEANGRAWKFFGMKKAV
jgi:hypothetical protein